MHWIYNKLYSWKKKNYFYYKDILLLDEYILNIGKAALFSTASAVVTSTYTNWNLLFDGDQTEFLKQLLINSTSSAASAVGKELASEYLIEKNSSTPYVSEAYLLYKVTHCFINGYKDEGFYGGLTEARKKLVGSAGFILGSKAGTLAGSFGGPVGAILGGIIGGVAGTVAASYADEISSTLIQNLDYTAVTTASQDILNNMPSLSFSYKIPKVDLTFGLSNYISPTNLKTYLSNWGKQPKKENK